MRGFGRRRDDDHATMSRLASPESGGGGTKVLVVASRWSEGNFSDRATAEEVRRNRKMWTPRMRKKRNPTWKAEPTQ